MRKLALLGLVPIFFFASCGKDDENTPSGPLPVANFVVTQGENCSAPCPVTFSNLSANSTSYTWDFGDGTPVSSEATSNVTHTYQQAGTYTVKLTAKADNNTVSTKSLDVVIIELPQPIAYITARPYKLTGMIFETDSSTTDYYPYIDDCSKDDLTYFRTNGEIELIDSGIQCHPPSHFLGSWSINSAGNLLTVSDTDNSQSYEITELNSTTLKFIYVDYYADGRYIYTYTAQ